MAGRSCGNTSGVFRGCLLLYGLPPPRVGLYPPSGFCLLSRRCKGSYGTAILVITLPPTAVLLSTSCYWAMYSFRVLRPVPALQGWYHDYTVSVHARGYLLRLREIPTTVCWLPWCSHRGCVAILTYCDSAVHPPPLGLCTFRVLQAVPARQGSYGAVVFAGACGCSAVDLRLYASRSNDFTADVIFHYCVYAVGVPQSCLVMQGRYTYCDRPTTLYLKPVTPCSGAAGPCGAGVQGITPVVRIDDDYGWPMLILSTTSLACIGPRTAPAPPASRCGRFFLRRCRLVDNTAGVCCRYLR